ncbi:MAG: hypothetical protein K0S23_515 [Fluviicola sp.]|jgi:hypothetical protein|uniref:hypothetical protein n=1 Tax=Fluviicola sp. TaxID=1917219 RepID=UPI0026236BFF|nr:hypothetical protein [Fluviicola sp.]MDF3026208.1 hypothetical protein [Fluviicola sp.]
MKVSFGLLIILLTSLPSWGQFDVYSREQELSVLLDSVRSSRNNERKEFWNKQFKTLIDQTLHEPSAFDLAFTKLRTLGIIDSPDKLVRIVNWNVEQEDGSQKYFAYVIHRNSLKDTKHKVIELIDKSFMLTAKPEETLEADMWYGALYYQIIPVEKANKTYYTVLGWDGGTRMSNTKLIDVLYFTGNSLKLGYPLFKSGNTTAKRLFFEHSERSVMSLRYESEYKRIIFDHLMPETPTMVGFYEFYVPDMSYDAYVLDNNRWVLKEDVVGVNKKDVTVSVAQVDDKSGEVSTTSTPGKWIDPTGEGKGSSNDVHVAVLPDSDATNTTEEGKKPVKKDKKDMTALEKYEARKKHKKDEEPPSTLNSGRKRKPRK